MKITVKTPACYQTRCLLSIYNLKLYKRYHRSRSLRCKAPYIEELAAIADGDAATPTDDTTTHNNGGAGSTPIHPKSDMPHIDNNRGLPYLQEKRPTLPSFKAYALKQWPTLTSLLVLAATAAALTSTATALAAPPSADLIELTGTLTAFTILSSVFIEDQEAAGIVCYMVGFVSSVLLLTTSFVHHLVPSSIFIPALVISVTTLGVNTMKLLKKESCTVNVWESWRSTGGGIGIFVLSQIVWLGLLQGNPSNVSMCVSFILGVLAAKTMNSNWKRATTTKSLSSLICDGGAWCATLIFMSQPVLALLQPSLLAPPEAYLLPALSTGLQVPRAMFVENRMWTLGTSWATIGCVLQAAVSAFLSQRFNTLVGICSCWSLYFIAVLYLHRLYNSYYKDGYNKM